MIDTSGIATLRDEIRARRDTLVAEVEEAERDLASVERTLALALVREPSDGNGRHRVVTVMDIQGCKTQRDIARRYAELSGGTVKVNAVAKLVRDTKRWGAKFGSLQSTVHNFLSNSDEWEWVEPGTFRWLRFKQ